MDIATDEATRLEVRRHYKAGVAAVYAACTDPEQMKFWMAPTDAVRDSEVELDVRVGGRYRIVMYAPNGETHRVAGEFREVVPPHRLVYTFGWAPSADGRLDLVPPGSSTIEIELVPSDDGTTLRFSHRDLPTSEWAASHAHGWDHYLARLAIAAAGGDAGRDPWLDRPMS